MQHQALEIPLQDLPPIDEHSIEIDAPAEAAWAALFPTLNQAFDGKLGQRMARALDCRDEVAEGDLHHPGGTLPGFVVARSVAPVMLALMGEHKYSRYALVFRIDLLPGWCRSPSATSSRQSSARAMRWPSLPSKAWFRVGNSAAQAASAGASISIECSSIGGRSWSGISSAWCCMPLDP